MEFSEFKEKVLGLHNTRKHKATNSAGVYDAYKYIRKNKWFDIGQALTESLFYKIIKRVNQELANNLLEGKDVVFPHSMGELLTRKYKSVIKFDNGKLKNNLPVNWNVTLKLWSEDEEAYKNKTLVKREEKEIFKICYIKSKANYNNKGMFLFYVNRSLKKRLKEVIKGGNFDAFLI